MKRFTVTDYVNRAVDLLEQMTDLKRARNAFAMTCINSVPVPGDPRRGFRMKGPIGERNVEVLRALATSLCVKLEFLCAHPDFTSGLLGDEARLKRLSQVSYSIRKEHDYIAFILMMMRLPVTSKNRSAVEEATRYFRDTAGPEPAEVIDIVEYQLRRSS